MGDPNKLGTEQNPLRVAVVGSGPSGFYTAESIIKSGLAVEITMLERLPAPYGLVRYGVAPDHPKLKQAIQVYQKIAEARPFRFLGNVTVGRDISVSDLSRTHHAVVFTCGAETDRRLGVPGEELAGSHTATEFVGWYNGHPDFRDREFDLSHEVAVIIGQGNVAADVTRILAKTVDELKHTDIAEHALEALAESRIREIFVVGRRGPAQAKFTPKELREFGELEDCASMVDEQDLKLNPQSELELADKNNAGNTKNVEIFQRFASQDGAGKHRRCYFRFLKSPVKLLGESRLQKLVLEQNRLEGEPFAQSARGTGEYQELPCGLLFRSIGYHGVPMAGVPFDQRRGVFANEGGRIMENGHVVAGLYAAGWIKRGPTGIIGTNRADSVATVGSLLADLEALNSGESKAGAEGLYPLLAESQVRFIDFAQWRRVDEAEIARGEPKGKPREKFTRVQEMLAVLG